MNKRLFIANWKMNLGLKESLELIAGYKKSGLIKYISQNKIDFLIAPSAPYLQGIKNDLQNTPFKLIAQDVSQYTGLGAYTGENSIEILKDVGITGAILGHAERREYLGETFEDINIKVKNVIRHKMLTCVCIGENYEEAKMNMTRHVIASQIKTVLKDITGEDIKHNLIIAYEPSWAISTNATSKITTIDPLDKISSYIREQVKVMFGDANAEKIRVVYGGSVTDQNIHLYCKYFDGVIVGNASLIVPQTYNIVKALMNTPQTNI